MHRGARLRGSSDYWHLAMMTLLYCCQGFVQALAIDLPNILSTQRRLSLAELELAQLPIMPFSFKFLWSPVVDGVYWTRRTRRPLWIAATHVAIILWLATVLRSGDEIVIDAASFAPFIASLTAAVVLSATQDISVDAWAIEGVSPSAAPLAAGSQSLGLGVGIILVQAAVVGVSWQWMTLRDLLQYVLVGYVAVIAVLALYLRTSVGHAALAARNEEEAEQPPPTVKGVFMSVVGLFRRDPLCRAAALMGLQSFVSAPLMLFRAQAVTAFGIPVAFLAEMELLLSPLVCAASLGAGVLLRRFNPDGRTSVMASMFDNLGAISAGVALLLTLAAPYYTHEDGPWAGALVLLSVGVALLDSVKVCVRSAMLGRVAMLHPGSTATVLTALFSFSNLSRQVAGAVSLRLLRIVTEGMGAEVSDREPFATAALIMWALGLVLNALLVRPAVQFLGRSIDERAGTKVD